MAENETGSMAHMLSALHTDTAAPPGEEEDQPEAVDLLGLDPGDPIVRFLDIPIRVSVQLARKRTPLREILELQAEAILTLNRSAGENVDLLLNGKRFGSGEIVVIEDAMGLRITDLLREEVGGRK